MRELRRDKTEEGGREGERRESPVPVYINETNLIGQCFQFSN